MERARLAFTRSTAVALLLAAGPLLASDWPQWSGPNGDLTASGGVFERDAFGLDRRWVQPLGSGYSGITATGDRIVTGYSDGESDWLAALSVETGAAVWRYRIGDTYEGHDGSDDGPISTPTIADGTVYGLGPFGRLFALRAADGSVIWEKTLGGESSRAPDYGYTTAPTITGDLLIVQTGGAGGHAISAFDRRTGELHWSTGDDIVSYQSPAVIAVDGVEQIVAATNQGLKGLSIGDGSLLWEHRYEGEAEDGSAHPVPVAPGRFVVTEWPEAALYEVKHGETGWQVSEIWRRNTMRGSYTTPVPFGGHLYGYAGNFLTCVDAATGDTVWKSRPPGSGALVIVDGKLVIQAESGDLVVAEASPAGYQELARVAALDRGYLTRPSFANGRVFVRNLSQIASLSVIPLDPAAVTVAEPAAPAVELVGKFGEWVRSLDEAEDKQARVDAYFAERQALPLFEEDGVVHFVYRGDAPDLAVFGTMTFGRDGDLMHRVAGTDLWFRSYRLEPASHHAYGFQIFDESMVDPANPRQVTDIFGDASELALPGWQEPEHLGAVAEEAAGRIETFAWAPEGLPEREVKVWLPPGYAADGERRYPVLLVTYGDQALADMAFDRSLANLAGRGVEPTIAAFVPRVNWAEAAGAGKAEMAAALANDLIPRLDEAYRTRPVREARGIVGWVSSASLAAYTVFAHPDVFGALGVQSFYFGELADELRANIEKAKGTPLRIFVQKSTSDYVAGQTRAAEEVADLLAALAKAGFQPTVEETDDGAGWSGWRAHTDSVLKAMFPQG